MGKSGSGKSTIIKLVLRLYDTTADMPLLDDIACPNFFAGAITIGDQDLKYVDLREYRSQIGYVGQEPVLFEGTVADNIRLGCGNVPLEDVIEASKVLASINMLQT